MKVEDVKLGSIWVVVGTRPEVIKQASLFKSLRKILGDSRVSLIGTGQHRDLLDQALSPFDLSLDINFKIMGESETLVALSSLILERADLIFKTYRPELIIVQGDTLSAAMMAWAGFLNGIPVAHNEAGLRTFDLQQPFPEEGNRRLITSIASWHFPPTEKAKAQLIKESVSLDKIFLTGNPGLDSMKEMLEKKMPKRVEEILQKCRDSSQQPVLLTAHRRENRGRPIRDWFLALSLFLKNNQSIKIIYPMHPNNIARPYALELFANHPQMELLPPLDYPETCHLISHSRFVVTDSGGIQEEASTLGVPVVVCRETSERMEAVEKGMAYLAGTDQDKILAGFNWALELAKEKRASWIDIFGDGQSGQRMAKIVATIVDKK